MNEEHYKILSEAIEKMKGELVTSIDHHNSALENTLEGFFENLIDVIKNIK